MPNLYPPFEMALNRNNHTSPSGGNMYINKKEDVEKC